MTKINHYIDDVLVQNYTSRPYSKEMREVVEALIQKNKCFDGCCQGCNAARCNMSVSLIEDEYDGNPYIIIKVMGEGTGTFFELDRYIMEIMK